MKNKIDPNSLGELQSKVVTIKRVSKTVKGGRNMRFTALVIVGDQNGHVGYGLGKSAEVPEAIRKAIEDAKKNMVTINTAGTSIPHEVIGKFGTGSVVLKPAPEGSGVIAGGPARAVIETAGIRDIVTKSYGTNNPINVVKATLEGLSRLKTIEEVARLRGKSVEELLG